MDKELEKTISDKLAEFFNDPIDIECSYCEAAKAVYPIFKEAVTEEIKKDNKIVPNFLYEEMSKALELEFENKYGKSSGEE